MQKEMIIKISKIKMILASASFLSLILFFFFKLDYKDFPLLYKIIFLLFSIGIVAIVVLLLSKINTPVLIMNEEGYIHMGKYFVWWGQVKDIQLLTVHQLYGIQRFIEVKLENLKAIPIDYTKENSKVLSYTQHSKKKTKYINMGFGVFNSTHKTKKVIEIMKQYKAEYDRLHKAKKINNDD